MYPEPVVVGTACFVVVEGGVVVAAVVATVPVGTQSKHRAVLSRQRGPDSWSIPSTFPSVPNDTSTCVERVLDAKGKQ